MRRVGERGRRGKEKEGEGGGGGVEGVGFEKMPPADYSCCRGGGGGGRDLGGRFDWTPAHLRGSHVRRPSETLGAVAYIGNS